MESSTAALFGIEGPLLPSRDSSDTKYKTFLTQAAKVGNENEACKNVPINLRQMFYEHFSYYVARHGKRITGAHIGKFAKVMGMLLKESNGNPAAVTDMHSRGDRESQRRFTSDNKGTGTPNDLRTSLKSRSELLSLRNLKLNAQTNFGLLQMSADRLNFPNPESGKARAAREMLHDLQMLGKQNPGEVLNRCGTRWLYTDEEADLRQAVVEMSNCTPGDTGAEQILCFAKWATLCPNYNITLALMAPMAYFQTRGAHPVCTEAFKSLQ